MAKRAVFERAYKAMEKYGADSFVYSKLVRRRKEIMGSMLNYYESAEEFEKCSFIVDFFERVNDLAKLNSN